MDIELVKNGWARINGGPKFEVSGKVDHRNLTIDFKKKEGLSIHCFKSLMFPIKSKRDNSEKYLFSGPKLGSYHDMIDIREGPYVNHFIDSLEITIVYLQGMAKLTLIGSADLSESSYDEHYYKGSKQGVWKFEIEFNHEFH